MSKTRVARRAAPSALLIAGLILGTAGRAGAQTELPSGSSSPDIQRYAAGEVIVRYRPGTTRAARSTARGELGATVASTSVIKGLQVLDLPSGTSVADAVEAAQSLPQVLYAEPNYSTSAATSPNDPMFGDMWSLGLESDTGVKSGIDTPRVWNLTTGSAGVTVAIVDTGIDSSHPDLAENMWTNPDEVPGNGSDDDGNGLTDDVKGWDFVQNDNSPVDENGHGTHVAGIVGAGGNNGRGVAGVSWDVQLLPLRVLDANGSGWTSDVAEAFAYAGRERVDVVNASLAGTSYSQAMLDAIAASPETLFVVAAGNSSTNVDVSPTYPCTYTLPNVICVAATGLSNELSAYSNYGPTSVDVAAPGDRILSTWPGGTYSEMWGTSMASPHVAGVAALLKARHPEAGSMAIRDAVVGGSDGLGSLAGRTVSGGRLSAAGAFERMGDVVPNEPRIERDTDQDKKRCDAKRRRERRRDDDRKRRARHRSCRARSR